MKGYKTVGPVKQPHYNEKNRKNTGFKTNNRNVFFSKSRQPVEDVLNKLQKKKGC